MCPADAFHMDSPDGSSFLCEIVLW